MRVDFYLWESEDEGREPVMIFPSKNWPVDLPSIGQKIVFTSKSEGLSNREEATGVVKDVLENAGCVRVTVDMHGHAQGLRDGLTYIENWKKLLSA